ncbi:MAG: hypothetical protein ACYCWE_05635 [Eubacteriales bacterium]
MNEKKEFPSNDQLIAYLNQTIDKELDKEFDEQDMDLIDECIAFLKDIDGNKYAPDDKTKEENLAALSQAFEELKAVPKANIKHTRIFPCKKIAAAACASVILIVCSVFAAASSQNITPLEVLDKWGATILNLPYDKKVEAYGMTFIRNSSVIKYDTIEDLLKSEQLEILYPAWMPEDIKIDSILLLEQKEGTHVIFKFNNQDVFFSVFLYEAYPKIKEYSRFEVITINGVDCYLSMLDEKYNAIFYFDSKTYSVSANEYDTLILLLYNVLDKENVR